MEFDQIICDKRKTSNQWKVCDWKCYNDIEILFATQTRYFIVFCDNSAELFAWWILWLASYYGSSNKLTFLVKFNNDALLNGIPEIVKIKNCVWECGVCVLVRTCAGVFAGLLVCPCAGVLECACVSHSALFNSLHFAKISVCHSQVSEDCRWSLLTLVRASVRCCLLIGWSFFYVLLCSWGVWRFLMFFEKLLTYDGYIVVRSVSIHS